MHEQEPEPHHEQEPPANPPPRIYVASLSDYNAGRLHGEWITIDRATDEIHDRITQILDGSPEPGAEEWAIHDYEGFHGIQINEQEALDTVVWLADKLAEHGPAFTGWVAHKGELDPDEDDFKDHYLGQFDSVTDYAELLADDMGVDTMLDLYVPAHLRSYVTFDAAAFGRDLELGGDIVSVDTPDGDTWIYDAH